MAKQEDDQEKESFRYLVEGKIYQLSDHHILPENYATFLCEAVSEFTKIVIEQNDSKDLAEVVEKHKEGMREVNPGWTDEDLFKDLLDE